MRVKWCPTKLACVWWCSYGCSGKQHSVVMKFKGGNVQLFEGFDEEGFDSEHMNTSRGHRQLVWFGGA